MGKRLLALCLTLAMALPLAACGGGGDAPSMGDARTLYEFLDFANTNYPADKAAVTFWNHGGGSVSGAAFDEIYGLDSLNLLEMYEAFDAVWPADAADPALPRHPLQGTIQDGSPCRGRHGLWGHPDDHRGDQDMAGLNDTDIRLSDEWQLTQATDGDAPLCSALECLYQNIILEALTQPGDLFYDLSFGWGLYDFIQSEDDEPTRLEIAQRARVGLQKREVIVPESIEIEVDFQVLMLPVSILLDTAGLHL